MVLKCTQEKKGRREARIQLVTGGLSGHSVSDNRNPLLHTLPDQVLTRELTAELMFRIKMDEHKPIERTWTGGGSTYSYEGRTPWGNLVWESDFIRDVLSSNEMNVELHPRSVDEAVVTRFVIAPPKEELSKHPECPVPVGKHGLR
jgi:hypothetical protein